MNIEGCLQLNNELGQTPCFWRVNKQPCSLDYCTAKVWMERTGGELNTALHRFCVMSDTFDEQTEFNDGKGEFVRLADK